MKVFIVLGGGNSPILEFVCAKKVQRLTVALFAFLMQSDCIFSAFQALKAVLSF